MVTVIPVPQFWQASASVRPLSSARWCISASNSGCISASVRPQSVAYRLCMEMSLGLFHSAEHTQLPELGHTRQKGETDIGITRLDDAVETLNRMSRYFFCSSSLPMVGQHRLVVPVNQNNHLMARLLIGLDKPPAQTGAGSSLYPQPYNCFSHTFNLSSNFP